MSQRAASADELGGSLQVLAAAPTAVADEFNVLADRSTPSTSWPTTSIPDPFDAIRLVGIDTAGTRGSVRISQRTTAGYSPNGKFDFLAGGQVGTDTFRYVIDGGNGLQATGTVTVRVVGVNDAPTVRTDWVVASEGGAAILVDALAQR